MKALSLPISSPSKFTPPQPLMRFSRGNAVRRSRTRMRAIPILGERNAAGLISETTEEPSSPKVTCIGQIRLRRSAAETGLSHGHTTANRRRPFKYPCRFRISGIFLRWVLCSRGKKVDAREDSFVVGSNLSSKKNGNVDREIVPENALSLTMCRSVRRSRSSSLLGGRIWESMFESCERGVFKTENAPKTPEILHKSI